jgi:undecaprenyl-diphosphatase
MTLSQAKTALSGPDYKVMRRMNSWRAPRGIRWWMLLATRAGDGWLWCAAGIALLSCGEPERFRALAAAACAVAAGIVIFHCLKRRVCRVRPCDVHPHCWAHLKTRDRFSFPSGHSTTAFAVALSMGSFYPACLPLLLLLAANVAISRVVLGMHFLSDVVAGSAIGGLLGYAAFRVAA